MRTPFWLCVTVLGATFVVVIPSRAQTWTATSASTQQWVSVACSADGAILAAAAPYPAYDIYVSTNSGTNWKSTAAPRTPSSSWYGVALSADGRRLVAAGYRMPIYLSTNLGSVWTPAPVPATNWHCIASSADGRVLAATYDFYDGSNYPPGPIYVSTNFGAGWTLTSAPFTNWASVACSADGKVILAAAGHFQNGFICLSTDSGVNWIRTAAPTKGWGALALSANGQKVIASAGNGVYTSADGGATWRSNSLPSRSVASSADGARLEAVGTGSIYTSSDSGATWVSNNVPNLNWYSAASSADGGKLLAGVYYGPIFRNQVIPSPTLNLRVLTNTAFLAWTVPSTPFVLQQNSHLTDNGWVNVSNLLSVDWGTLQYQISLPLSLAQNFYRLVTP